MENWVVLILPAVLVSWVVLGCRVSVHHEKKDYYIKDYYIKDYYIKDYYIKDYYIKEIPLKPSSWRVWISVFNTTHTLSPAQCTV